MLTFRDVVTAATHMIRPVPERTGPLLFLDIQNSPFGRYLAIAGVLFYRQGWTVCVPAHPKLLVNLLANAYTRRALQEGMLRPVLNRPEGSVLIPRPDADYFSSATLPAYYMPVPFHPDIYFDNMDILPSLKHRSSSIFFAGSFKEDTYAPLAQNGLFPVTDRITLRDYLRTFACTREPSSYTECIITEKEYEIIILDSRQDIVPQEKLFETLSSFDFFMAFPGSHMPLCHNLAEAIYAQTIPVIQRSYGKLLHPPLTDGKTALFFESLDDLPRCIAAARTLSAETKREMRRHLRRYYRKWLSPEAITGHIISAAHHGKRICIPASRQSTLFLKY
ncbi:MAG: hypothetical protein ACQEQV_07675 [Fibrobacterota bacterium]